MNTDRLVGDECREKGCCHRTQVLNQRHFIAASGSNAEQFPKSTLPLYIIWIRVAFGWGTRAYSEGLAGRVPVFVLRLLPPQVPCKVPARVSGRFVWKEKLALSRVRVDADTERLKGRVQLMLPATFFSTSYIGL